MTSQPITRSLSDDASALRLVSVTPSDAETLTRGLCRALFVGVEGDVTVEDAEGTVVTIPSLASQYHPVRVRRVLSTGTTASRIFALY